MQIISNLWNECRMRVDRHLCTNKEQIEYKCACFDRDLLDEAKDYHLMPERRSLMQTFKIRPRCCTDVPGLIYAVGGLTSSGE